MRQCLPSHRLPPAALTGHTFIETNQLLFNTSSQVLPLIILFVVIAALAWLGLQIYQSVVKIQEQANKKMGKKHVVFTKDGVRVGVKHVENEAYVDKTQSWFVKAWNLSAGGNDEGGNGKKKYVQPSSTLSGRNPGFANTITNKVFSMQERSKEQITSQKDGSCMILHEAGCGGNLD